MNKKGQLSGLSATVTALILLGMLIGVGLLILVAFQDGNYTSTAVSVVNESLAKASTAGVSLATGAAANQGVCGAVTSITNSTAAAGAVAIGIGNITQSGCVVYNATDWSGFTANVRYSYPYTYGASNSVTTGIGYANTSISTLAQTWLPIIVIVLCAAIILGIIGGAFGGKKK